MAKFGAWESRELPLDFAFLLEDAIRKNASDVHLSVGAPPLLRIDGELRLFGESVPLTEGDMEYLLGNILTRRQMRVYKSSNELDFSYFYEGTNVQAHFRGNAFYGIRKMAAVFRRIPVHIPSLDELALPPILRAVSRMRRGIFLVTGATGSGKSTTLAAIVNEINKTRREHLITIEDPVEYIYQSDQCLIQQREISLDTDSFAEGLRSALRQDPDVLLIGEMRDWETIDAAISASEMGHTIFSTLHTMNASQSIDRIVDVFPHEQQTQIRVQLAGSLMGICSQQLIPKKEGGRVCATEILIAVSGIRNCIAEGKTSQIRPLLQMGILDGMHTMEQDLARLVKEGSLSADEALSYAYDQKDLQRILSIGNNF
jgi:twitching motility protein PilT